MAPRKPVSIVCVYNDPEVRRRCLDRSIDDHRDEADVEYLPIDNVGGAFSSAGAALNFGVSLASHDYVVFAHQDVYLHSLRALELAAGALARDPQIGMLGAVGVSATGEIIGRIRDRVILIGEPANRPIDVDSLDEVLFMAPRRVLEREPLSESPDLAWHAYAVEYGLRARSLGLRVCAVNVPLTHNSLTVNLDRLDAAYEAVAAIHPTELPVRATCGTVAAPSRARPGAGMIAPHRWRYRWLRESVAIHLARLVTGGGPCVLADIRLDIDAVLASASCSSLTIINLDLDAGFADQRPVPLELLRECRPVTLTAKPMPGLVDTVTARPRDGSILLTNLGIHDLRSLSGHLPEEPRLLGFRTEIGYWMLLGPVAAAAPGHRWTERSRPLGMPALA